MKFKDYILILEANTIEAKLRKKFPEVRLVIKETDDYIIINVILIQEKRRNKGEMTSFIKYTIKKCTEFKKDIYLTPSDIYGADLEKLKKVYKSFGFITNTNQKVKEEFVYLV